MPIQDDRASLEQLADTYRAAYVGHDPASLPLAADVRFTENNVVLQLPDGSWDAVTEEVGPPLTFVDPATGGVCIFTAVMLGETPGYLTVRLRVEGDVITEVEHLLSTRRLVSAPPTPFGDVRELRHQPGIADVVDPAERSTREQVIAISDGYFATLSRNDGTLYATFAEDCHRIENGWEAAPKGAAHDFLLGRYRFNQRVRREWLMVDEERGLCLGRAFIDHKGLLTEYELTDGTMAQSPFREPHTWSVLEAFKIRNGEIAAIEATFIGAPYHTTSPWTTDAEVADLDPTWNDAARLLADRRGPRVESGVLA